VAELFFKFGSFAVECIAFLGLWYGLNKLHQFVLERLRRQGDTRGEKV
jgi:hypothetical protein